MIITDIWNYYSSNSTTTELILNIANFFWPYVKHTYNSSVSLAALDPKNRTLDGKIIEAKNIKLIFQFYHIRNAIEGVTDLRMGWLFEKNPNFWAEELWKIPKFWRRRRQNFWKMIHFSKNQLIFWEKWWFWCLRS